MSDEKKGGGPPRSDNKEGSSPRRRRRPRRRKGRQEGNAPHGQSASRNRQNEPSSDKGKKSGQKEGQSAERSRSRDGEPRGARNDRRGGRGKDNRSNEGSRSDREGSRSRRDGNRSGREDSRPRSEWNRSGREDSRSRSDGNRSGREDSRPRSDGNRSGREDSRPRSEWNRSDREDSRPRSDGNQSGREDSRPRREDSSSRSRSGNRRRFKEGSGASSSQKGASRGGTNQRTGSQRSRGRRYQERDRQDRGYSKSRTGRDKQRSEIEMADQSLAKPEPEPETDSRGYEEMSEEQLTFLKSTKIDDEALLDDLPEHEFKKDMRIADQVGVKMDSLGSVIMFDCQNMYFDHGDKVVVETGRGLALGEVVVPPRRSFVGKEKLSRVIRKATQNDMRQCDRNKDKETAAHRLCQDRIDRIGLPMKLIRVEYLHGGNKAIFYFSAEGRIDFRELVRDLARRLHTRIEMRQIGVRDVSRMLGGVGTCGCQLCCSLYLREFQPVSIRMAKDQNLVLNPQKVSGICGRLLCCLTYEDKVYREAAREMPRVGRRVNTPDGDGRIRDRDVLKRVVRVLLSEEGAVREYPVDQISMLGGQNDNNRSEPAPDPNGAFPDDDKPAPGK